MNSKSSGGLKLKLICAFFALLLVLMQSSSEQGQNPLFAQLVNLIAPIAFVFAVISEDFVSSRISLDYFKNYFILFLFIIIFPTAFILIGDPSFSHEFYQSTFYILLPLASVYFIGYLQCTKEDYEQAFFIIFIGCMLSLVPKLMSGDIVYQLVKAGIAGDSEVDTESDIVSFMFGLLTIYYFKNKKYKLFILALLFSILSFKRIVLTGICISLLVYTFLKWYPSLFSHKKIILVFVLLFNLAVPMLMLEATNDSVIAQEISEDWFDTSIESLTMGRKGFYSVITQKLGEPTLLGVGYGKAKAVFIHAMGRAEYIHSDLIKLLYELGFIGYCIWVFFWYRNNTKQLDMFALSIYMNILFISDNVFVYFPTLFLYYLLQSNFLLNESLLKNFKIKSLKIPLVTPNFLARV